MLSQQESNSAWAFSQKTLDLMEKITLLEQPAASEDAKKLPLEDLMRKFERILSSTQNSQSLGMNMDELNQLKKNNSLKSVVESSYSSPTLIKDLTCGYSEVTLKVRVSYKSPSINNTFLVDIFDAELSEARIRIEGDLCKSFERTVEEGGMYIINNIDVRKSAFEGSRRKFTIRATTSTTISPCDEDGSIPIFPPGRLYQVNEITGSLEIIDIVLKVWKLSEKKIRYPEGEPRFVRDIWLVDSSGEKILLTLWSDMIERFSFEEGVIVLCRGLKCDKGQLRLVSTGDTAFITTGIDKYAALFSQN